MGTPLQYGDDDEDDLFDSSDEDEQETENDLSSDIPANTPPAPSRLPPQPIRRPSARRLRIRPMSAAMAAKQPRVVSMLFTRDDGSQVVFVRNK